MSMHTFRTRFAKDIVAEFLPPARKSKTDKVIIFCDGMPTVPNKRQLLKFFSQKGYWVFHPRYRGSWESSGSFLKISPHKDILDVIDQLPKGFKDLWSGRTYKLKPKSIYVIGGSFGGPAAILVSNDKRVNKVIAISPVVDWQSPSKSEPLGPLLKFVQPAFGQGYRIRKADWQKLSKGKFYNPVAEIKDIDPAKILIIHAKDDDVVSAQSVKKFAAKSGSKLIMRKTGGHLYTMIIITPGLYPKITKFLAA